MRDTQERHEGATLCITSDVITCLFRAEMAPYWTGEEMIIFFVSMAQRIDELSKHLKSARNSIGADNLSCRTKKSRLGNIPDRHGKPSLRIRFSLPVCRPCPLHAQCAPIAAKVLILCPDRQSYQAPQENRKRQETSELRALYAKRAGVESSVAQVVRICEIRRSRYIGQNKLNLQAFLIATSMNVLRACH
jgi:hypothetical protein